MMIYSVHVIHAPCLDAWSLPCLGLVDYVSRFGTDLFHTFSLDYFHVNSLPLIKSEDTPIPLFTKILYSVSAARNL